MICAKKLSVLVLCAGLSACASQTSPEDAQMSVALSAQGKALLASRKPAEAKDVYLSAVSRDENNARAWNGLGVSYALLGKRTDAERAYRQALEIVPNDKTASNNLAQLFLEQGDARQALALLEPFADDKDTPTALKQNLARARAAAPAQKAADRPSNDAKTDKPFADLGAYPTQGIAQGYASRAKAALDDDDVVFSVATEVKVFGGTPVFVVKATGEDPERICTELTSKAFPCIPRNNK